jgi:hypothetical protein
MGFLDKAKKMAEQAQSALDEAQKQFQAGQQRGDQDAAEGAAVEYDEHGRRVPQSPSATASPPQGDPLAGESAPARPGGPTPDPDAPPAPGTPTAPHGDRPPAPPLDRPGPPGGPDAADAPEDRNHPSYAPPKLTSGDPLQG